jgi:hypothetical protein
MSKYLKIIWIILMIICPIGHLSYESYIPAILNSEVGSTQKMITISLEIFKWTVWSTLNLGWLIASVSFYSFFIFSYYRLERQLLKKLEKTSFTTEEDIIYFRERYSEIQHLREDFNDRFGLIPFFWFGELFIATCFRITQFALIETADSRYFITYLYEYLLWALIQIILALFLGYLNSNRYSQLDIIHIINSKNNKSNDKINEIIIFNQIVMTCNNRNWFEAWDIFVLDRKLIFQFLAAVIPFSVMLIQLSKERFKL